jgi:hypothetical protein
MKKNVFAWACFLLFSMSLWVYADLTVHTEAALDSLLVALDSDGDGAFSDETWHSDLDQSSVTKEIFIPISWFVFNGLNDPSDEVETDVARYRDFDSASAENGEFFWQIPSGLTGSAVKFRAVSIISSSTVPAANEGVSWEFSACASGTDDNHDCASYIGTEASSEDADLSGDANAQWDLVYFPYVEVTPASFGAGELLHVHVERDVADTQDDYLQDIALIGVMIKWQEDITTLTY